MHLAELPSESELGEVDISRWLMTRRNVASYDCRSDVSAGLPGIAYVTRLGEIMVLSINSLMQMATALLNLLPSRPLYPQLLCRGQA